MKKYLLLLITFLASFIFFNNVKAESIGSVQISKEYFDNYFHSIYDLDISSTSTLSIEEIIESFKTKLNYNSETEDYFIYYIGNSAIYMYTWEKGTNFSYPIGYFFNKNSSGKLVSHIYGYSDTKMKYISYHYSSNTYNPVSYANVINGSNILFINSGTISNGIYDGTGALKHQYFSSSVDIIVSDYNNYNGYYDLLIDDGIICHSLNTGSILFNADGSLNIEPIDIKFDYEENINCKDKSKIIINFKPTEEDLNLQFESQFSEHLLNDPILKYEGETTYTYKLSDYIGERFPLDAQDLYGNELYSYNGTYEGILGPSSLNNFNNIKIEIDLSGYGDYDYYLKFTSNLEYTIEYEYVTETIDYYKTIFMNDTYGLYLIPKTLNQDLISNIFMYGIYNIEIRKSYEDSENYEIEETLENYNNSNFQYKFSHDDLGYLIYFENVNYNTEEDNSYYLTFDTRQFNYAIKELQFDSPTITNPNTGEDLILPPTDNINKEQGLNSFLTYLEKLFYPESIKNLFDPIYKLFRNSSIGGYIFIVLISSIIILIIKAMKK